MSFTPSDIEKLWSRCGRECGCWPWVGARTKDGYGRLTVEVGAVVYTHRMAFEVSTGQPPGKLWVLHRCDNPPCCNPEHLFLGTRRENVDDMLQKRRNHFGERTGGARLEEAAVAAILSAYATGEFSVSDLARAYDVTEATVRAIVNGQTWTHVPGPRLPREIVVALGKRHRAIARWGGSS